jgi:hypothetical protein
MMMSLAKSWTLDWVELNLNSLLAGPCELLRLIDCIVMLIVLLALWFVQVSCYWRPMEELESKSVHTPRSSSLGR